MNEELHELFVRKLHGETSSDEDATIAQARATSPEAEQVWQELFELYGLLRSLEASIAPPPGLTDQIMDRIDSGDEEDRVAEERAASRWNSASYLLTSGALATFGIATFVLYLKPSQPVQIPGPPCRNCGLTTYNDSRISSPVASFMTYVDGSAGALFILTSFLLALAAITRWIATRKWRYSILAGVLAALSLALFALRAS